MRNVLNQRGQNDYEMYVRYTDIVDPLLEMPQIYHQEIKGITIYSDNVDVAHGESIVPMSELEEQEWNSKLSDSSLLEWFVKRG